MEFIFTSTSENSLKFQNEKLKGLHSSLPLFITHMLNTIYQKLHKQTKYLFISYSAVFHVNGKCIKLTKKGLFFWIFSFIFCQFSFLYKFSQKKKILFSLWLCIIKIYELKYELRTPSPK